MKKNIFIITCLLLIQLVIAQSPGGVSGSVGWYKADSGISATTWTDQSGNGNNLAGNSSPVLTNYMNFNTVVTLNGTSQYYRIANTSASWPGTNTANTYYMVALKSSATGVRNVIGRGDASLTGGLNIGTNNVTSLTVGGFYAGQTAVTIPNVMNGNPFVGRGGYNGGTGAGFYLSANGSTEVSGQTGVTPTYLTPTNFTIGVRGNATVRTDYFDGNIAEVVVYPGKHTPADYNKVESYLATKWGVTKSGDYVASNGTTTYWTAASNTGYTNNIAGIGRDDTSGLHQRQSQSQNAGVQPVIGNNSTIIATNTSGAGDFATDNNFMLWGSDTGSDKIETAFAFGSMNARMGKIWKIQETNTVGTVKVALRKSDFNGTNQHLLVSNNATFDGSDTMIAMTEETIDGVVYFTATVDFINGQFFSFASYVVTPGGVIADISAWFKADSSVFRMQVQH